jgi:sugar O-acyltransferase (sialic acid O-acetyltransferase NeuD family)
MPNAAVDTEGSAGRARPLYVIGAGGHAKVVVDILLAMGTPPLALLDENATSSMVLGIAVLRTTTLPQPDAAVIVAIGDNAARERAAARYLRFAAAVHPSAIIGRDARVGDGSVVMAGAVVNPGTRIGNHCIVNTRAGIDHDCMLEDFASVAPGATLGGGVQLGRGAVISLGASVIHGCRVGDHAVVGAGAVVVRDVPPLVVVHGVPARVRRPRTPDERYL